MKKQIASTLLSLPLVLWAGGDIAPLDTEIIPQVNTVTEKAWDYEFEVYMFASGIDGKSNFGNLAGDVSISFLDDTIPNLKLGGMARIEAHHKSGWGYWLDYGFMNLGNSNDVSIVGIHANTDVGLFQGVLEGAILNRSALENGYIDYFVGFRWWDNDYDMAVRIGNVIDKSRSRSEDWVDGFVGARWTRPLNDNWSFRTRGDIGAGAADFTAILSAGVLYKITESLELDLRYKALWVDYETSTKGTQSYYRYDTVTHGPLFGLTLKF